MLWVGLARGAARVSGQRVISHGTNFLLTLNLDSVWEAVRC